MTTARAARLPGAGAAARTTSIQVGDTKSSGNAGDLGSDSSTRVRSSSDGDGAGGADRIDFATLTGTASADSSPEDNSRIAGRT